MPTNDFKPFGTAGGANVLTQAEYEALAALSTGWTSGKANSKEVNKAVRQATFIAAAVAQFVSDKSNQDVLDDGNLAGFGTKLIAALNQTSQPLDATLTALAALVGAANKIPYFNGADAAALTDLTQVGRDIIGKGDITAVLQYLGLSGVMRGDWSDRAGFIADNANNPYFHHTASNVNVLLSPIESPALTGMPKAPTPAQNDNSTQIATTEFVKAALAALVDSSPGSLDTLNELAAALGDDPNFSTTMLNALAGKQPLDNTLTNLSGKSVSGLLTYLGLTDSDGRVGRLINVRVITTSGTYTPTAGTKSIVVEVQGAGGAGGAAGLVSGSNIAMGGGGAAGAYARSRLTAGFSGISITIGAKGTGKKPDYSGNNGGSTSFGTITAEGGTGGVAIGTTPPFIITAVGGAAASGGSIVSITGASSLTGIALSASYVSSGSGGSSPMGSGGGPRSTTIAGDNASGFGSGGSGALNLPGAAGDLLGGDGSNGVVIVWEYA